MTVSTAVTTDDEIFTPDFYDDPYPTYRAFMERDRVLQLPFNLRLEQAQEQFADNSHTWLVTGFDECSQVLHDHRNFSSVVAGVPAEEQERSRLVLINTDPPRHTRLRTMLNKAFTPRRINDLEPWVRNLVATLLDGAGAGSVDIATTIAEPLPIMVIASLIGVADGDLATFKTWSDAMVAVPEPETIDENRAKTQAMFDYIGSMVAERRSTIAAGSDALADDFLAALIRGSNDGTPLEDWEITSFCVLLLLAGNETTRNLITCLLNVAVDRPALWQALRADRALITPAIEESLRFDSPVQILNRWATADVEVGGHLIREGENVAVASRPATGMSASSPSRTSSSRTARRTGTSRSASASTSASGAPLARLETQVLMNELLDRYAALDRTGPPRFQHAARVVRGLTSLPLELSEDAR